MMALLNKTGVSAAVAGWLLTLSFQGCSAVSPAKPELPPALEGSAWVQSAGAGSPAPHGATIRFEAGRVVGSDGCNRFSAPYKSQGASFELGPRGASTMMACPPEIEARTQAFMEALHKAKSYRVSGQGMLELLGADGQVLQALAPQPMSLVGMQWNATSINNGKQAVVSLVAGSHVTLNFSAEGRVSGSAGCNQFNGAYRLEGGSKLSIGPVVSTRMMCMDAGVAEQERAFLQALESVATLRIEGTRLELRRADGGLAIGLQGAKGL
ncbi:META domain-containing protein [Paucibacter sp. AS339]|uniref:META domain-containing protein n=1 Tax=Paucibacter hankyongi TaxID=3133434 RepID=UPI003099DB7B